MLRERTPGRERREGAGRRRALAFALAFGAVIAFPAASQTPSEMTVGSIKREPGGSSILDAQRRDTARDLAVIAERISLSRDAIRSLDNEIAAIAADREEVREAMIAAAAAQKSLAVDLAATEARIGALSRDEGAIKVSLRERRGLLAQVLGALQRMGRKPPPAILVRPADALGSIRSAILLGSVVPSIRGETEVLIADLERLASVKGQIVAEKDIFAGQLARQREEEARLARLFAEKEKLEATNRGRREAERERAAELADEASGLEDLIVLLEREVESTRVAEAAARKLAAEQAAAAALAMQAEQRRLEEERTRAAEASKREQARQLAAAADKERRLSPQEPSPDAEEPAAIAEAPADAAASDGGQALPESTAVAALEPEIGPARPATPGYDVASLRRDMPRLEPVAAFSTMKGRLTIPVAGKLTMAFGRDDDIGRAATGASFAARAGELVTAPADGHVLYSGPFRSYGQLLILNAGDGYHVVLAGMSRIDVAVGQFVSAGEPVGIMGAKRLASVSGGDFDATEPTLYVEFRKDGKPVNPSPWWTEEPSGRTRNGS